MCGIAAIVSRSGSPIDLVELDKIRDAQAHRGPDGFGSWLNAAGTVGLAHRRLAIVDLSPTGAQPMCYGADETLAITFNGEIYNYRELRRELSNLGHRFFTESDTEVLLVGYREWGDEIVQRLRGMFAFVLRDDSSGRTVVARDPLGIKPLYVRTRSDSFAIASEVQALRIAPHSDGVDLDALSTYLLWGSIPSPLTLHTDIRALEPGTLMTLADGEPPVTERYYRLADVFHPCESTTGAQAAECVRAAVRDSVDAHLVADTPVGAFLSGGVDSSVIVAHMAELGLGGTDLRTVTVRNDEDDESQVARDTALQYGAAHAIVDLSEPEALRLLPAAIDALDQPSVDGINTFFVARATAQAGLKVALTGVGGDELFGGYSTFGTVPRIMRTRGRTPRWAEGPARRIGELVGANAAKGSVRGRVGWTAQFGGSWEGAYYIQRGLFSPAEVRELVPGAGADLDPTVRLRGEFGGDVLSDGDRISTMELGQYVQSQLLRDADAVGMRHSLEIRTPFIDRELFNAVGKIPASLRLQGPAKRLLRESVQNPISNDVWDRPKRGFALPFDRWIRSEALLLDRPRHELLSPHAVDSVFDDFANRKVHWSRVWALLVLERYLPR